MGDEGMEQVGWQLKVKELNWFSYCLWSLEEAGCNEHYLFFLATEYLGHPSCAREAAR